MSTKHAEHSREVYSRPTPSPGLKFSFFPQTSPKSIVDTTKSNLEWLRHTRTVVYVSPVSVCEGDVFVSVVSLPHRQATGDTDGDNENQQLLRLYSSTYAVPDFNRILRLVETARRLYYCFVGQLISMVTRTRSSSSVFRFLFFYPSRNRFPLSCY